MHVAVAVFITGNAMGRKLGHNISVVHPAEALSRALSPAPQQSRPRHLQRLLAQQHAQVNAAVR
jgi:hypothetical protein